MSAAAPLLVRTFPVGAYECTVTFPRPTAGAVLAMAAEWSPWMPNALTNAELAQYRAGRDAALVDLAEIVGGSAAVIE